MSFLIDLDSPIEIGSEQKKSKEKELACVHCRKWHTKCDRKKPTCSLCIERNIPCLYEKAPKKRGPRGGKVPVLDDIKKIEQEIEHYKQLTSFWQQKTRKIEQQYSQLFSEGLLLVEPRGMFKLSNSMLFHTLIDIYMWGGYPSYEIKPPFQTLEEFESSKIYTPQKGLMYSILASSSAYIGDVKLYKQLEQETKASIGPLFDNSNYADVTQSHFMMAEAQMSMGDGERALFYADIARKSTDNFVSKYSDKPQAKHLKRVSDFTSACLLGWEGHLEQALKMIDQIYNSRDISLSGDEPNYVYQLNILQMKIALEVAIAIRDNISANVKQYNSWIAMIEQGDQLLKHTEKFPDKMRVILELYQETVKALIFFVGNQPQFILECVKAVIGAAHNPICICSYWVSTILAVVTGFCVIYDWQEELEKALYVLDISSYRHPTSTLLNNGVRETIGKYGKDISFADFVRNTKAYVDKQVPEFNRTPHDSSTRIEVIYSSSTSSPEIESTSPISDPEFHPVIHGVIFQDEEANAFLEQIMIGNGSEIMDEAVNSFVFNNDAEFLPSTL